MVARDNKFMCSSTGQELIEQDRMRPAFLFEQCTVTRLDEQALKDRIGVIQNNTARKAKRLRTGNGLGPKIDLWTFGSSGLQYQGRSLPPCKVSWQNEVRLRFAIKDVRPGQLRHMCEAVGLGVVWMRRIRVGRIPLGKLPVGEWRHLPAGARF